MNAYLVARAKAASAPVVSGRIACIERAKGLAITFVVLGHLAREAPPGHEWYMALKDALYQFHMPFFMFLSGFTMIMAYRPGHGSHNYVDYVRSRFRRLMPSFLLFGLLVLVGKEIASWFVPVDNMHADILSGAVLILTKPITSSAGFLWYIYTLFLFHLAMPLMMRVGERRLAWLLAPALVLHYWPMNKAFADWFMFSQFAEYLLYLVLGFLVARDREQWLEIISSHVVWFVGTFVLLLAAYVSFGETVFTSKTVVGVASIPALLALTQMPWAGFRGWLAVLGAYSFTIYLLNMPFIGIVKCLIALTSGWQAGWFPLIALCMIASGLLLPVLLSKQLLQRVPWLDRVTR